MDLSNLKLPEGYIVATHCHRQDLYIIYVRSVLRIVDYKNGNTVPEDTFTLEMQDYYNYDFPAMMDDSLGRLWCHIGGRLFRLDEQNNRWDEVARFPMEKIVEVTDTEFVFDNHLQYDASPYSTKRFNFYDNSLIINN